MQPEIQKIWSLLQEVPDPEVPVLSVVDLGVVRDIKLQEGQVAIWITPTYSGCPAVEAINMDIRLKLIEQGYQQVVIHQVLSPAWTTEWMSPAGKEKLKAYGIAPPHPVQVVCDTTLFGQEEAVQCPLCNSYHTQLVSRFGSTACKALYKCLACQEPFDYFKCH